MVFKSLIAVLAMQQCWILLAMSVKHVDVEVGLGTVLAGAEGTGESWTFILKVSPGCGIYRHVI